MFIDSNVLLRLLLNDHPDQSLCSKNLLVDVASSAVPAWTSVVVFFELAYNLQSPVQARLGRIETAGLLRQLLAIEGLEIDARPILAHTLDIFEAYNIDFADAYHSALVKSRGETTFYSFDHDFDRIPWVERIEPPLA